MQLTDSGKRNEEVLNNIIEQATKATGALNSLFGVNIFW
jgi:hypothetical protein